MIKHKKIDNSILRRPMLPVLALVVGGAALVVSAILAVTLVGVKNDLGVYSIQQMKNAIHDNYWTGRLEFCYERELNPCSADVLDAWNKAYPEDTFSSVPPSSV